MIMSYQFYDEPKVKLIGQKFESGIYNAYEADNVFDNLSVEFEKVYRHFICLGGGVLHPEYRLIEHMYSTFENLNLEFSEFNLYVAAQFLRKFVFDRFGGFPFPGAPNYELYKTGRGLAAIMNKILAYQAEGLKGVDKVIE